MLDLFAIAAKNADSIDNVFNDAVTSLPVDEAKTATEFAQWVDENTLISINIRLFVIAELLCGIPYRNIHEWAEEQADLSGKAKDLILRERLKGFYEKRMTFDRAFQYGERFKYGALNAGGLGLSVYAPYCAVLSPDFSNALDQIACLPGDSLDICFARAGKFDHIDLEKSVGPYSHRHWMVTSQRIGKIDSTPKHGWQQLLISPDSKCYFEIIFIGDITLKSLHCVRIPAAEYQAMWELAFANYGRKLSEAERAWVQDFIQLIRASKDGKIQVEVIT